MKRIAKFILFISFFSAIGTTVQAQNNASEKVDSIELKLKASYTKREVMIPMRDGVKL